MDERARWKAVDRVNKCRSGVGCDHFVVCRRRTCRERPHRAAFENRGIPVGCYRCTQESRAGGNPRRCWCDEGWRGRGECNGSCEHPVRVHRHYQRVVRLVTRGDIPRPCHKVVVNVGNNRELHIRSVLIARSIWLSRHRSMRCIHRESIGNEIGPRHHYFCRASGGIYRVRAARPDTIAIRRGRDECTVGKRSLIDPPHAIRQHIRQDETECAIDAIDAGAVESGIVVRGGVG